MRKINLVKALYESTETLKQVGASVNAGEIERFIETCDCASNSGEYGRTLIVGSVSYPLDQYEVADALLDVVLPRKVALHTGFGSKDLMVHPEVDPSKIMTPAEFKEFQFKWHNVFKAVPSFSKNLSSATNPVVLSDVLGRLTVQDGVRVEAHNLNRPITLCFEHTDANTGEINIDEFVRMFAFYIINKLRG